jgi:hypothetical protein
MAKVLLVAAVFLTAGCGRADTPESADSTPAAGSTTATTRSPEQPARDTGAKEIYIDSVAPGNPILVRGRARTFENTVQVRARDASGALLDEVFTTSNGEMGHHNPFEAQVWLTREPGARVTIEAFEYSAKDGSVRSLTSRALPWSVGTIDVTLMFPKGDDCTTTTAVTRRVPRTVAVARLLVEALVNGPNAAEKSAGASSPFPERSQVRSVILRNGVLTVDFNEALQNVGGACRAQAIRAAVTGTLSRLPSVRRVVITAFGSEAQALQP